MKLKCLTHIIKIPLSESVKVQEGCSALTLDKDIFKSLLLLSWSLGLYGL